MKWWVVRGLRCLMLAMALIPLGALAQTRIEGRTENGAEQIQDVSTLSGAGDARISTPGDAVVAEPAQLAITANVPASAVPVSHINAGDTAWMMTASVLVLLMTVPGLALFYAGMVRKKNVLATLAQTFAVCALVSVLWVLLGYSLAFQPGQAWLGGLQGMLLQGLLYDRMAGLVSVHPLANTVPEAVFVLYQLTFAIITPALIAGAFAERMRFGAMLAFTGLWSLLVYAPVAHWVWEPGGWLANAGVLDFAGGMVVHINAGMAGLVCAWKLGRRIGFGEEPLMPANLGYTMLGASLLWVGWMGFNGGAASAADGRAAMAMLATQIAAASATLAWMAAEWVVRGRPSLLGLCSGAVAGLVAITPASGYVSPASAMLIGACAGVACYWGATGLKRLLGADDSLDVFGVHGIGGIVGAVLTGVLASPVIGGVAGHVEAQVMGVAATLLYSGVATWLILLVLDLALGLRVSPQQEVDGLDLSLHGERLE
jgi:ammonium transporter, Amt family